MNGCFIKYPSEPRTLPIEWEPIDFEVSPGFLEQVKEYIEANEKFNEDERGDWLLHNDDPVDKEAALKARGGDE